MKNSKTEIISLVLFLISLMQVQNCFAEDAWENWQQRVREEYTSKLRKTMMANPDFELIPHGPHEVSFVITKDQLIKDFKILKPCRSKQFDVAINGIVLSSSATKLLTFPAGATDKSILCETAFSPSGEVFPIIITHSVHGTKAAKQNRASAPSLDSPQRPQIHF